MSQKKKQSNEMNQLKEEFPDLSQSTLNTIVAQNSNALASMKADFAKAKNSDLEELYLNFQNVPKEIVRKIYEQNGSNFDNAMNGLIKYMEEENVRKQADNLMNIFQTLSKEIIQQVLEENEGDIELTTAQLLDLVTAQEAERERQRLAEEQKKQQEQNDALLRIQVQQLLRQKFGSEIEDKEIVRALQEANWNVKEASVVLHCMAVDRKKAALQIQFPSVSESEISGVLDSCNYEKDQAADLLKAIVAKQQEEQQKKAVLKPVPDSKPNLEVVEPKQPVANLQQIEQNLLERSLILGQELENEMKKNQAANQKEVKDLFRNKLTHVIETQARFGVSPGIQPPPTIKEIDERLQKKAAPVKESETIEDMHLDQNKPAPLESASSINYPIRLTVSPTMLDVGNPVTVHYEILSGESNSWDWIGMFSVDTLNKEYLSYQYRGKGDKEGTVTFTPSQYGTFEFRYFPAGTMMKSNYQHLAKSNAIKVGPQFSISAQLDPQAQKIKVNWKKISGNVYSSAWIGLFQKGAPNREYLHWEYATTPEVLFDVPIKPATYEFRFFSHSFVCVAVSESIQISGSDKISLSVSNGVITLEPHIVTVDPKQVSVWLGLFLVDQKDNKQWIRYKYLKERFQPIQFRAPKTPGTYEFRLFASSQTDTIVKTDSFII